MCKTNENEVETVLLEMRRLKGVEVHMKYNSEYTYNLDLELHVYNLI
jgi:hypothetical protein